MTIQHHTLTTSPAYLPPALRHRTATISIRFRFSDAERKVFRRRKPMAVSTWCEQNRVVTLSSLPGPWRNEVTPYMAGIMDASLYPSVQEIDICKAPQTAGSEGVNNCIGYVSDRFPGPVLYVFPDERTARENCQDRITPMFSHSPRLLKLMSGRADDAGAIRLKLKSSLISMAWAGSVSTLANKPIRYLVMEEVDKYPATNKVETDAGRLAPKRTTTFRWNRKIWRISSPSVESGPIWQSMLAAQVIFEYAVRCPVCHQSQVMRFGDKDHPGGIKWPLEVRDPEEIKTKELAWYECAHCQAQCRDYQRDQAVRDGGWQARGDGRSLVGYLETYRPRHIAFHLPSWLSPFVSLSEIAAAFLACRPDGKNLNLNAHKDFCNGYLAEPWFHHQQDRKEDTILALRDARPEGLVPGDRQVAGVVAYVDTQDKGFWYKICAIGYGLSPDIWVVRYGYVIGFDNLARILWEDSYLDAAGNAYLVEFTLQDAMGHRTKEVYDFCLAHRGRILPTKGAQSKNQPFSYSNQEFYPGEKRPIPDGLKLVSINTTYYKNDLASRLEVPPTDPGAWHLHAEPDEQAYRYAAQMVVEYRDDAGFWQCPNGKANHLWDCGVGILVVADIRMIKYRKRPDGQERENRNVPAVVARSKYASSGR